ncbi:Oidioi.mRNA.OKI2018_I69.PAR.g9718.t1.cds [Oikopleura dioica]|uniref:Oidioi.mRNA.OKI2018_I69.PAR.g9718.t1.cds n=1 Tax=Oikopleura dioica TaxID=34765 RepID=A0ABN7RQI8_OIKDI|nr:Oidioi.mRNA.OKI2018_I69.PAR.g9718.t1.cds [Oikopleura dioica]
MKNEAKRRACLKAMPWKIKLIRNKYLYTNILTCTKRTCGKGACGTNCCGGCKGCGPCPCLGCGGSCCGSCCKNDVEAIYPDSSDKNSSSGSSDDLSLNIEEQKVHVESGFPVHEEYEDTTVDTTYAKKPEPVTRPEEASKYRYASEYSYDVRTVHGAEHENVTVNQKRSYTHFIH